MELAMNKRTPEWILKLDLHTEYINKPQGVYKALHDWQIRVLCVQPGDYGSPLKGELLAVDVLHGRGVIVNGTQNRIEYDAVSYCWGDPERSKGLMLDQTPFLITLEAYNVLQRARSTTKCAYLWIDAICINQTDDAEKSHQIRQMLTIYAKARRVLVWLEEPGDDRVKLAVQLLQAWERHLLAHTDMAWAERCAAFARGQMIYLTSTGLQNILIGYERLLFRPWFDRVWTKQEIWAGRHNVILCGDQMLQWSTLYNAEVDGLWPLLRQTAETLPQKIDSAQINSLEARHRAAMARFAVASAIDIFDVSQPEGQKEGYVHTSNSYTSPLDIVRVLQRCAGSRATLPQDHIYGCMGMSALHPELCGLEPAANALIPSYTKWTARDVFTAVTRYVIHRDKCLHVIYMAQIPPGAEQPYTGEEGEEALDLPSWGPDWRRPPQFHHVQHWRRHFRMRHPISFWMGGTHPEEIGRALRLDHAVCVADVVGETMGNWTDDFGPGNLRKHHISVRNRPRFEKWQQEKAAIGNWVSSTPVVAGDVLYAVEGGMAVLVLRPVGPDDGNNSDATATARFRYRGFAFPQDHEAAGDFYGELYKVIDRSLDTERIELV